MRGSGSVLSRSFFGMHDHDPASWPRAAVGAIRLWDSGVTWPEIETAPGVFRFGRLDRAVSTARAHGAEPLIVLGMTPAFHARKPHAAGFYGPGSSSPPKLGAWQTYVRKVAARYGSRGVSYQVWNEANVSGFWSGSQAEMARLTQATYDAVRSVSPGARIVGPAYVTRTATQVRLLDSFYGQRPGGRAVSQYIDVVSLQLYPRKTGTPESSMQALATDRAVLARHGVHKPIWNTEINYGLTGGRVRALSSASQRSYVARTFLLNAAAGIQRVFWYGWDSGTIANTRMSLRSGGLAAGGGAFEVVEGWLSGHRMRSCSTLSGGTYLCTLTSSGSVRRVFWNPRRSVTVAMPARARTVRTLSGGASRAVGRQVRVTSSPVLVESPR